MATKLPARHQQYNFLSRQSAKDRKKTARKAFAFGNPVVRAARKKPAGH